jgi:hypothetical protein
LDDAFRRHAGSPRPAFDPWNGDKLRAQEQTVEHVYSPNRHLRSLP